MQEQGISLSLVIVSLLLLLAGRVPSTAAFTLNPQNVTTPFWEPLPFASLPIVLATTAVFYQDTSVMGKVYTIGGQPTTRQNSFLTPTRCIAWTWVCSRVIFDALLLPCS